MNEFEKRTLSAAQKESFKRWLKEQMTGPYDSEARKQEIDQMVEHAAQCAVFIEEVAKICGIDLDKFVVELFGLKLLLP